MIWKKLLKWLLTMVDVDVSLVKDILHLTIKFAGTVVYEVSIDLMPEIAGARRGSNAKT